MSDIIHRTENTAGKILRGEYVIAFVIFAVILLLKIAYVFSYRFDSDEPQHLHIVWGWANGLLQYRDVFDNHTPLFHILCTPIFIAFGERPDVLFAMRLVMIPLYVLALWSTYVIGREIFSQRVGLWATIFVGLFGKFFLCTSEFRTDVLWTALWLLALALFIKGSMTLLRSFMVGVFLGAAIGVSQKTVVMLVTVSVSALATVILSINSNSRLLKPNFRKLSLYAATMFSGLLLVPLALILFFYSREALVPFFYGTVKHNILPGQGLWIIFQWSFFFIPIALVLLWWGSRTIIFYSASNNSVVIRRVFVFFVTGVYILALTTLLPFVERQSRLPLFPLCIIFLTQLILMVRPYWITNLFNNVTLSRILYSALVPMLIAFLEIVLLTNNLLTKKSHWHKNILNQVGLLTDVLRLTNSNDPVIDLKGEMIFRQRSFYYGLEQVTRKRIELGLITDDIPEHLVATNTCVAALDNHRFPLRTRSFLNENYLPVGHLRVVGRILTMPVSKETHSVSFDVQIPARYAIVAESGIVAGWLDGTPFNGIRFLADGHHEFCPTSAEGKLALVWAQAVERGFSPFSSRK